MSNRRVRGGNVTEPTANHLNSGPIISAGLEALNQLRFLFSMLCGCIIGLLIASVLPIVSVHSSSKQSTTGFTGSLRVDHTLFTLSTGTVILLLLAAGGALLVNIFLGFLGWRLEHPITGQKWRVLSSGVYVITFLMAAAALVGLGLGAMVTHHADRTDVQLAINEQAHTWAENHLTTVPAFTFDGQHSTLLQANKTYNGHITPYTITITRDRITIQPSP